MAQRILVVYNADGGLWSAALDSVHKLLSPATYPCRLCDLSYGLFGMKRAWAETIAGLPCPVAFLHRDEWAALDPQRATALPAILIERGGERLPLVSAADFARLDTLPALQALLADRLAALGGPDPAAPGGPDPAAPGGPDPAAPGGDRPAALSRGETAAPAKEAPPRG